IYLKNNDASFYKYEIYTITNQLVASGNLLSNIAISVTGLRSGSYLLKAYSKDQPAEYKTIIIK
ncbi:MAG: T9SS type A sorting domain-containing protein, partial [Bacteroidales bacterium]|nr:T9SS type A sorting domain-containing protein [Bacteroidales bacterium]